MKFTQISSPSDAEWLELEMVLGLKVHSPGQLCSFFRREFHWFFQSMAPGNLRETSGNTGRSVAENLRKSSNYISMPRNHDLMPGFKVKMLYRRGWMLSLQDVPGDLGLINSRCPTMYSVYICACRSYFFWLVVSTSLKNMKVNWDEDPKMWKNMFQTTH